MIPSRLILCRHGSTELNGKGDTSQDRIRGWIDVPLDDDGRKQARELADRLKDFPISEIHSSPLVRAEETAQIIADEHWLKVRTDRGLMPWNVGSLAGQPTKDVLPKMIELAKHETKPAPEGEPFKDFRERTIRTLVALLERAKRAGTLCAVSHTRDLQLAKAWTAAGRKGTSIDVSVMDDYAKEIGTGGMLILTP